MSKRKSDVPIQYQIEKRQRRKKISREGAQAVSVLYYYNGRAYKHVFTVPVNMRMKDGEIILTGGFTVNEKDGITDNC